MINFSATFDQDLEKLMPLKGVHVVRGILETLELDPFLALDAVHEYLSRWRKAYVNTWAGEYPYVPKYMLGVTTYRFSDTFIHFLDRKAEWEFTILYQEANKLYMVCSFARLMDDLQDLDHD
jgi:hypothetical protein